MSRFNDLLNKKAVALKYDERQSAAPVVVASGMGHLAEKMVEIANENDVPVYEDNSLATVLTQLDLGTAIPEELYQAIVDIYTYFLKYTPKHSAAGEASVEVNEVKKEDGEESEKKDAKKEEGDS